MKNKGKVYSPFAVGAVAKIPNTNKIQINHYQNNIVLHGLAKYKTDILMHFPTHGKIAKPVCF
jgi:hypothetical protein